MEYMFLSCGSLESLDISHFFTSQVKSMKYMFASCSSLITLDLSSFDTSWVEDMRYMFAECESLKTLDISSFDLSQIHKYGSDSFLDKTGLSDLQQVSVKQPENLWPSVVRELAELGESCYQLEQAKMDIRACKRHGIPLFESELQWLQKAAVSGEKEAQLKMSVYYNESSIHFCHRGVLHGSSDSSAFFWQKRAWTRYLTPRNVSYPPEFNRIYEEDSLTADQQYIIALDYDLKIRSEAQKMHSEAADRLNEEEFLKLKGIVERNRESWLRKAAEHGSKEAQYDLGILLYPVSQEEGLDWLDKSQAQGYELAKTVLSRRAEQEANLPKAGFLGKMFRKKTSEKNILPLEINPVQEPEFLGLCRLVEEGDLEAKLFLAKEYEKGGLWDQAFPLYIPVAWSGNHSVMEIVAGCYAEGKGTEKNLAEASFWYERALRRGNPAMEDPAKNLDEQEKRELLSSKQKHILRLDAEAGAYEKQKSREGDEDVEVSKL
ncbi:bacterial surface protein 26-residue repeat [uncultured Clostridium sp.]|nr:bacterial surface protein 26-residue repeat [uncultured Clostridium sp.]